LVATSADTALGVCVALVLEITGGIAQSGFADHSGSAGGATAIIWDTASLFTTLASSADDVAAWVNVPNRIDWIYWIDWMDGVGRVDWGIGWVDC
jgi:hypothetical protein